MELFLLLEYYPHLNLPSKRESRHYKKYVKKINFFSVKNGFRDGAELKTFR